MEDMEMLEKAAAAAGIEHDGWVDGTRHRHGGLERIEDGLFAVKLWNPLEDDGDAFGLMVKLGLDCCFRTIWGEVLAEYNRHRVTEMCGDDPHAAARRAIVRAVAEKWGK